MVTFNNIKKVMETQKTYCGAKSPDWAEHRRIYSEKFFSDAEAKDDGQDLFVDVRWVVLYQNDTQKIPLRRIQDCHRMLNLVFNGGNTDELAKIPETTRHPWKSRVGNPNIKFMPLDHTKVNAEYIFQTSALNGQTPVDTATQQGGRTPGVLNIYIGASENGGILGQAELSSNIVYGLYSAIGGYIYGGTMSSYALGKTIAHEVGHSLSLSHTFSDSQCDHFSPFPDVPEQIRPNYSTSWTGGTGTWDLTGDNRQKDRDNGTSLSCLHIQADPNTAPDEMGINIMDYGDDEVSVMFTQSQATMMRSFLTGSQGNIGLRVSTDLSYSEKLGDPGTLTAYSTGVEIDPNSVTANGSGLVPISASDAAAASSSSSSLSTNDIIIIVVSCVIGVLLIGVLFWYFGKRNKHKMSGSYMVNGNYNDDPISLPVMMNKSKRSSSYRTVSQIRQDVGAMYLD